jgi:HEAT repeat protein
MIFLSHLHFVYARLRYKLFLTGLLAACLVACSVKRVWFQQDIPDTLMRSDLEECKSDTSDARSIGGCMQAKGYLLIPRAEAELLTVRALQDEGLSEQEIAAYLHWGREKVSRYTDEDYELRHTDSLGRQPVDVLTSLGKPAVEPLIAELEDDDPLVRRQAAQGLGEIKDPRAVEPLIDLLNDGDSLVRRHAAKALGRIKDVRAVSPLIEVLNAKDEQPHVRMAAAEALGWIGERDAVEALVSGLKDPHWIVQSRAAIALGRMRDSRAVEPLISALTDEDALVRGCAADALGKIKDSRAIEPLRMALEDSDTDVRKRAHRALTKITGNHDF